MNDAAQISVGIAEMRDRLPAGWRLARLGEVCSEHRQIVENGSGETRQLPYLSLEHIESISGRVLRTPSDRQDNEGASTTFRFDKRHVLYGKLRPYLNKVAVPEFEGRCTTELLPLLPTEDVDREFLGWLLRRPETVDAAMRGVTGSRMPRANMRELFALRIPLPPPQEQKRIVAILNEQMAAVKCARLAAEAELQAAEVLLTAYLRTIFDGPEAKVWPVTPLGEISEIVSGLALGRKLPNGMARKIPYITVANVKDGYLDLSEVRLMEATQTEIDKCMLKVGDIILTEGGDPDKLGRGTVWEGQFPECVHQNHIFRVRFSSDGPLPAFVAVQISSSYSKRYFFSHAKRTTGIATINRRVLSRFPLLLPPRERQHQVVSDWRATAHRYAAILHSLQQQLTAVNALPAALSRRAFNGEL